MAYKYYQPNEKDLKDNSGDCVVRALTKVLSGTWLEIFDRLTVYARKVQQMPNSQTCYEALLKESGFKYTGISNKKGTKRPTVASFAKTHKKGTYFVRAAHHVVAVVDGIYYDKWDSGNKSLYGYWTKE